MSFCAENVGNWSSSPQNDLEFSPKIYPEVFPVSPGAQLQEITVSTFSIQLGYNPRSDRKKRFKLETYLDRPMSNTFGAKAHANVLKGTFSTDCKSDCIRISLTRFYIFPIRFGLFTHSQTFYARKATGRPRACFSE